jgi:type IV secretory pathway TraG/TraD family ATPase VirD4
MLIELFSAAASYSQPVVMGSAVALVIMALFWIRLSGTGIRRDGDQILTPVQVLTRGLIQLYAVAGGFFWYVYLQGPAALQEDAKLAIAIPMPAALLSLFVPEGSPFDRNVLAMHGAAAAGFAVLMGFLVQKQLNPGSFSYELIDRMRLPVRVRGSAGSSHFCTVGEYRRYFRPAAGGLVLYGAFWGQRRGNNFKRLDRGQGVFCLTAEDAARGILVLGAPGSGKTQGMILPTIADRMRDKQSMIVVDPQGELRNYIVQIAELTGHRVAIHDPTDPVAPRFNLAQGIRDISDARAIAEVLIPADPNPNDRFWSDSASNLLAASLMRFTDLGSIYEALTDLKTFAETLASKQDAAYTLAGSFVNSVFNEPKLAANIAATLSTALAGWADDTVAENTRSSDVSAYMLDELTRPTVIVFTCPGRTRAIYAPYLGACLRRMMIDLDAIGEKSKSGALSNPVSIIVDEFPQLGRMSSIVGDVNLVRKRNMAILLAAQTLTQLQMNYGLHGTQSLLTGMATQIVFGGCDMATAEFYSRVAGLSTEYLTRKNEQGIQEVTGQRQRALMTPDEVMSPPRGTATIFARYVEPNFAAQVVVLSQIARFYERRDWRAFFAQTPRKGFELVGKRVEQDHANVRRIAGAQFAVRRLGLQDVETPVQAAAQPGASAAPAVFAVRKHGGAASGE